MVKMNIPNYLYNIIDDLSIDKYLGNMQSKHLSIIINKKEKITPIHYNYIDLTPKNIKSIHAEISALNHCYKNNIFLKNSILLVIRRDKNDSLLNSKPCINCLYILKNTRIKYICYSTGDKNMPFVYEKIKNINTEHKSRLYRICS